VELHKVKDDEEKPSVKPAAKVTAAKKTKDASAQGAANAEKPTKSADADLPENMKSLLGDPAMCFLANQVRNSVRIIVLRNANSSLTVVVTGVPPTLQRKNAEKLVVNYGGKLVKSISKNTSFVVLGNEAGPKKLEQIEELALETLDEDAFVALLEAGVRGAKRSADGDEKPVKAKKQKK
jgi:NAD-dependent DNA ligase